MFKFKLVKMPFSWKRLLKRIGHWLILDNYNKAHINATVDRLNQYSSALQGTDNYRPMRDCLICTSADRHCNKCLITVRRCHKNYSGRFFDSIAYRRYTCGISEHRNVYTGSARDDLLNSTLHCLSTEFNNSTNDRFRIETQEKIVKVANNLRAWMNEMYDRAVDNLDRVGHAYAIVMEVRK
jgi:hypothetical protein